LTCADTGKAQGNQHSKDPGLDLPLSVIFLPSVSLLTFLPVVVAA
jgi:hypothetical protein